MNVKQEQVTASDLHKKAIPSCSHCGSCNVRTEAFAQWNKPLQEWRVAELLDGNSVCADCGMECEIKWRLA